MIGRFKRGSKVEKATKTSEAKASEAKASEAKTSETKTAEKKATEAKAPVKPKAPKAKKPGLFDTMRVGWTPPKQRPAARAAVASGSSPAAAASKAGGAATMGDGVSLGGHPVKEPELLRQRDRLARQFAELQWDLGGIVYEMSSRKQFRAEVLDKQVEKLTEVDSKLGQVERLLRLDQEGAAGTCPSCGALQARGAVYCWQCGKALTTPTAKTNAKPEGEKKSASEVKAAADAKAAAGKAESAAKPEATK